MFPTTEGHDMSKISGRSMRVPEMIRDREPFETFGSFYADNTSGYVYSGHLRGYDLEVLSKHRSEGTITYVVWSYATPIAWWSEEFGWHKVRQTFSVTSSKHQGRLYLIDAPSRWEPFFDASLRDDLACRRDRGKHEGPVGYTDDGTLCQRHYEMRPKVKQALDRVLDRQAAVSHGVSS
jgi:hypothetical protein